MTNNYPAIESVPMRMLLLSVFWSLVSLSALAAPMPRDAVPEPLRTWVPWVLHGHETVACPQAQDGGSRACAWPSDLELELNATGGTFRMRVAAFAPNTPIPLPGDASAWPREVRSGQAPLPVLEREGRPVVLLGPGDYVIGGRFAWSEAPQSLSTPAAAGVVRATLAGRQLASPDGEGRLWLRREEAEAAADALSLRVFRLVDDAVPMTVTTRYEIAAAGRPRELVLPAALLPDFLPLDMSSPLPARLGEDGRLRLQLRPGNWSVSVTGRRMAAVTALSLPAGGAGEEIWSFQAHNDVRLVSVEGVSVDPQQTGMPSEWKQFPAYRVRPGESLKIRETRRGDPQPAPDRLRLARNVWLDFDGGGYTLQDSISGELSRSWRLEAAAPVVLGRVSVDGQDQPVTRAGAGGTLGVEVRHGIANINADSRIEGGMRVLPATAWQADFSDVSTTLHLPPGWRLLHAGGVDRSNGEWLAAWNLWDFFFVLVSALAAARLFGRGGGMLYGAALALTWHLPGAPQLAWPVLLALIGLERVLPAGRLATVAAWGKRLALLAVLLMLIPFAVLQVRQAIYPSLEGRHVGFSMPQGRYAAAPAAAPAAPPPERAKGGMARKMSSLASDSLSEEAQPNYQAIDPGARVQTGPGLPAWRWHEHHLVWAGPVERGQQVRLWLLPPRATAALTFAALALLGWAFWLAAGRPRRLMPPPSAGLVVLLLLLGTPPPQAMADSPPPQAEPVAPPPAILDELRERLTAPPDCMPACASLARLDVAADGERIRLRLEMHSDADVMVPLPGQPAQFRPDRVLLGSAPATLRRDQSGNPWLYLPKGVNQVVMEAPAGDAATLQIALPMTPHALSTALSGWTLSGLDANGRAGEALTLSRVQPVAAAHGEGARSESLPPFVRVERLIRLADRWTVRTTISREGPSKAPVAVRVRLLAGEAVNDPAVRVEDGHAVVALGQSAQASFVSTLPEGPALHLVAGNDSGQAELWRLDADTRWHVALSGIPPVHYQEGERWLPVWRPWPGERADVAVSRPQGVAGQTLTLDAIELRLTPGQRATDATATFTLRSSQGGNHAVELPAGAELLSVSIDGRSQPIRPEGRRVTLPLEPGSHAIELGWREARAMGMRFSTSSFNANTSGTNATLVLAVPADRWVLAVGGPLLGPAVLFWGVVLVLAVVAWGLSRTGWTPLGAVSWFLLGLGLAQSSLPAAAAVAGWFVALAARRRFGATLARRRFNLMQVLLVLWSVVALLALVEAVHSGLLGYPDMLIQGNGSDGSHLAWYQDRVGGELPRAWAVSVPLYVYRALMLAWALWLARSVIGWARWAWSAYAEGGYWKPRPPGEKPRRSARRGAPAPSPAPLDEGGGEA